MTMATAEKTTIMNTEDAEKQGRIAAIAKDVAQVSAEADLLIIEADGLKAQVKAKQLTIDQKHEYIRKKLADIKEIERGNYTADLFEDRDEGEKIEQPRAGETGNLLQLPGAVNGDITEAEFTMADDAQKPAKRGKAKAEPEHELEANNDRYDAVMRHLRRSRKRDKGVTAKTLAMAAFGTSAKSVMARAEIYLTWLVAKGFLVANETPGKYNVTDLA